ncbi:MAG TPA: hypothetical protein VG826_22555 [Pirellulales bacterium]|nr:hypothetical protein [Pirellulales bacterium]
MTSADRNAVLRRVGVASLLVGVVGAVVAGLGYGGGSKAFLASHLVAFLFWLGISLGSMIVCMLHGVTGGGWGLAVRRVAEAALATLPLMALAFVPVVMNVATLYEWADPSHVADDENLQKKVHWLNVEGYETRAVVYFGVWIATAVLLNLLAPNEDPNPESRKNLWLQRVSGAGMILYGFSMTLAAVDWVMSLEPHWYSSMYGVIYFGGQALAGMSFCVLVMSLLENYPPWNRSVNTSRRHDLGNLLLAMVMFWAYTSFMQYLIIWSGNLPEENVWYLHRSAGGYECVVLVLMGFHFAVPFALLLSRDIKQKQQRLMWLVAWLLVMRLVDWYWLAVPAIFPGELTLPWQLPACMAAIGGFWLAIFSWRLASLADRPIYDPALLEGADEHAAHA